MELTHNHRESLLNELEKAQKDAEIQRICINKQGKDEMSLFLAEERIKLIKKSLTNNEIDF